MGSVMRSWIVFAWLGGTLSPAFAQQITLVSATSSGVQGNGDSGAFGHFSLSADARFVAFDSVASNFFANDTNGQLDVFVRDLATGSLECVSLTPSGGAGAWGANTPSISADGRFVTFESLSSNLVANDTNNVTDVFVRDRQLGTTECVSVSTNGVLGNSWSGWSSISADGRFIAFESMASNLVAGDTNSHLDIFVRDRLLSTTERMSVTSGGAQASSNNYYPVLSADGRVVAFESQSWDLIPNDTNSFADVFVHDRVSGLTELAALNSLGAQANFNSGDSGIALSGDGRFVAFGTWATNLVPNDTNSESDVFLRDRLEGATSRASVDSTGAQADLQTSQPSLSADGRFVAFSGLASNLVAGDTNGVSDVFVRDLLLGTTTRVNLAPGGVQANGSSGAPTLSPDGRWVVFSSLASNLVANDNNLHTDVFLLDRGAPAGTTFCSGEGNSGPCPCGNFGSLGRGCTNSAATGGALLGASGVPSLASDTLALTCMAELPSVSSLFLQGDAATAGTGFGDGLRCAGGHLKRLYVHSASGGTVSAPAAGDLAVSLRSAALGDVLAPGATRYYQVYYRDPDSAYCPSPQGNDSNVSSGVAVVWGQ